jgi:phosphoserine aminotransferase
MGVEH